MSTESVHGPLTKTRPSLSGTKLPIQQSWHEDEIIEISFWYFSNFRTVPERWHGSSGLYSDILPKWYLAMARPACQDKSSKVWKNQREETFDPSGGALQGCTRWQRNGVGGLRENEWDILSLQLFHFCKNYLKIVISLQWGDKWHYRAHFIILATAQ